MGSEHVDKSAGHADNSGAWHLSLIRLGYRREGVRRVLTAWDVGALTHHRPTSGGRCRTCRRFSWRHLWRRRGFPCMVWHQIRGELLGVFAGGGRHRQPATRQLPGPVARPPEHTAGGGA